MATLQAEPQSSESETWAKTRTSGPIGILGAGVMGTGVGQAFAQAGLEVVLVDVSQSILSKAIDNIHRNLKHAIMFGKIKTEKPDGILRNIRITTQREELKRTNFIIENTTESLEIKKEIYSNSDVFCNKETIIAANTSVLSITRLASFTSRPDKVLGIHFMNPVPMKPTVEMIRGFYTSQETIEKSISIIKSIDKSSILVNDMPGFVSNRVLMLTINEAIFIVSEGTADASSVDKLFRECFGHKMGPLQTADLIGLDTILLSLEGLFNAYKDTKFRPCPLLQKMVDAGLHGMKSGRGFYQY